MRLRVADVQVVKENRDRLWSVAGCFQPLQAYASKFNSIAIVKRSKCVHRLSRGTEIDVCAHMVAQFQVSRDKIGV